MTAQKFNRKTAKSSLRLSVIICTYNRSELVQATLGSLYDQTLAYKCYEVIVVDNGSTDGTYDALARFITERSEGERHTWHIRCMQEARNGLAYARHKGLQAASGDILVFLDDDTLATPTFLESLLEAYEQTGADALGPRVELRWEAQRPHWLSDDLRHWLGYFAPAQARVQLPAPFYFSNSCFSIKANILRKVGLSSPLLSKRLHAPLHMESEDLCCRLHQNGYALWYDPAVFVIHRIAAARLQRSFFRGQAYWQGRAEVLACYIQEQELHTAASFSPAYATGLILPELRAVIQGIAHTQPLLAQAQQSSNQQLQDEMEQAYNWGRLSQTWQLIERTPLHAITLSVLLVHGKGKSTQFLKQSLWEQPISCATCTGPLPLSWLWRHRAHSHQPIAIIHIYQPRALHMTWWQRPYFRFTVWLARQLGIRIVVTDAGGRWQHIRSWRTHTRYRFEQQLFRQSDLLLTYTPHLAQFYTTSRLAQRICYLAHPGMLGCYPQFLTRPQAYARLRLPPLTGFVYLCLAYVHDAREILFLIEAFIEAYWSMKEQASEKPSPLTNPQLLILGRPRDNRQIVRILHLAATHPAIRLFLQASEEDSAVGIAAAHALIFPHRAARPSHPQAAGTPELAMTAYSYGRLIIAPDLPCFRELFPLQATISFTPGHHLSLVQALLKARQSQYQLSIQEEQSLDATRSWKEYAQKLLTLYQQLLH